MKSKLIECKKVIKIYQEGTAEHRIETIALQDVNLEIYDDDFIAIMGPSGSGKTTLLNLLGGLDQPSAGNIVYYHGDMITDVALLSISALDEFRRDKFAIIFQMDNLFYHLSALENVQVAMQFLGDDNTKEIARDILNKLGLEERMGHFPSQLSAGERQRVALASAIACRPRIILADEPTGELDSENVKMVLDLFKTVHETAKIVFVLVTHNPVVADFANRIFTIYDGKLNEINDVSSINLIPNEDGVYNLILDKFGRIVIPQDLTNLLDNKTGLYEIVSLKTKLKLIKLDDVSNVKGIIVQMGSDNKILVPGEIKDRIEGKTLLGQYDEDNDVLLIEIAEETT